jgi:hypothetical protein
MNTYLWFGKQRDIAHDAPDGIGLFAKRVESCSSYRSILSLFAVFVFVGLASGQGRTAAVGVSLRDLVVLQTGEGGSAHIGARVVVDPPGSRPEIGVRLRPTVVQCAPGIPADCSQQVTVRPQFSDPLRVDPEGTILEWLVSNHGPSVLASLEATIESCTHNGASCSTFQFGNDASSVLIRLSAAKTCRLILSGFWGRRLGDGLGEVTFRLQSVNCPNAENDTAELGFRPRPMGIAFEGWVDSPRITVPVPPSGIPSKPYSKKFRLADGDRGYEATLKSSFSSCAATRRAATRWVGSSSPTGERLRLGSRIEAIVRQQPKLPDSVAPAADDPYDAMMQGMCRMEWLPTQRHATAQPTE